MLGLFPTNKTAKKGGLGGLLPSLPDLLRDQAPCVGPCAGCVHFPQYGLQGLCAPLAFVVI